jgi:hypothetical protein
VALFIENNSSNKDIVPPNQAIEIRTWIPIKRFLVDRLSLKAISESMLL